MNVKARDYISPFYKKALEIAKTYKQATGVDCFVINNKGYRLNEDGAQDGVCPFCTQLNQLCDNKADCRQAHLYGGYQAERFGGSYIYFCPINMLHWASPLMEEGLMTGALIAGPSLIIETDELIEELKSKFGEDSVEQAGLRENLEKIPLVTTEKAKALSELLLITASHLIEGDHSELTSKKDSMDQQSQISEYIQYIKQMEYKDTEFSQYPIEKERELLHLIQTGDSKEARRVLNEILGAVFFSSGGKYDVVKARVLELLILLSRAAVEGGADAEQIFGMNYNYLKEINNYNSVEGLAGWLARVIVRFSDLVFDLRDVKHADAIYQTIQYINKNYADKVTLDEVASAVYLSPAYFSKIFKEEMKCNFNTYLNQVRINKSKNLLMNSKFSLVEIAGMVGYEDQSYYTKVFKKMTDLSPGKYREKRGKIDLKTQEIH
ncbi:PocR ligand-binding domain-containing protein [Oceanispirochaeta sp.]|jgi:two-component system response regulator YesN|uniref:PocR ligand-binding domain-containing protein n=1 Tax=Oceanispirochaeta sp. TaxID=2035350 RepID=UPI00261B38B5|nr:PocR ligand-binding domain-containing protein [Oceanispirochaeta sp.]MDA3957815.1 PocR ligand-binding domain-containing protein [Oceanispirochaeta sp.]